MENEVREDNLNQIRKIIDSAINDAVHFTVDKKGLSNSVYSKIVEILVSEEQKLKEKYESNSINYAEI
jgi:hypothetical protein